MNINSGLVALAAFELAGLLGTVICGWMSDSLFKGNRSKVILIFILATGLSIAAYWLAPVGTPFAVMVTFIALIGAFIYGPVGLIGLRALDLSTQCCNYRLRVHWPFWLLARRHARLDRRGLFGQVRRLERYLHGLPALYHPRIGYLPLY